MTTEEDEELSCSPAEYIYRYQVHRPSFDQYVVDLIEPRWDSSTAALRESMLLMVTRVVSPSRLLLVPYKASSQKVQEGEEKDRQVDHVLLSETTVREMEKQFPGLSHRLKIGSIIQAKLNKMSVPLRTITHSVRRVEKVWDEPLFPIRSTGNLVQVEVKVDLSVKGRCWREIHEPTNEVFYILSSNLGMELSISRKRLEKLQLDNEMTMIGGGKLTCTAIAMPGAPTPFRILDTCKIIKKKEGEEVAIPLVRAKMQPLEIPTPGGN